MRKLILNFFILSLIFSNSSYAIEKLRFIGDQTFKTGEIYKDTIVGGLSGLVYDHKTKKLLSVSDDPSKMSDARFYEFDVKVDLKSFKVSYADVITLKDATKKPYARLMADLEAITIVNDELYITNEGYAKPTEVFVQPSVHVHKRNGDHVRDLEINPKYFFYKDANENKIGSRRNKAFESISATEDGKTLYLASEDALFSDGPVTSRSQGGIVRIKHYTNLKDLKEFAYKLDPIPVPEGVSDTGSDNGLAEILAIDDKTFYTLERNYIPALKKNGNKLFKNTIEADTTNVVNIEKLNMHKDLKFVKKELVMDLDEVVPLLTINYLDNMEGMAFGPTLPNGNRSLIIVSDNNFGKGQRTLFIAFEVIPNK